MKNFFKNIILFILFPLLGLGGFGSGAYAQLFPVQLTPVFKSPYSVKISDYATSMDTKFQLLINPTDVTISQRQVRLKLYIQGNGVNIRSSDYITGQRPIFINGGEFQTLTNTDISALFRLENLQGITPAQYANPLPDGMYDFCFEMYDYITNQKISQKSCTSIYLILNDPPLLNTPQKNEQIAASDFSNIMFTWTPRQMNATNVSYKFELKQLIDPTLDPQFAFQMAPLLYEETAFSTAMLYNLSMPILTPGMRYAWRVRAISTTGLSENAIFKNDGYSEIYSFKYTASCASPTFLLSEAQGPTSVKITWQGIPEHTKYQLQYKKQDVRNAQWFSTNSLNTQSLITNLEPGVTYQFRVGSSCDPATEGIQSFTYSAISNFTTPTQTNGVPAYNCGIIPKINIQNQKTLTNLIQSETFTAGDFPVTVLELKGENSPYSGKGYIIVPYLADTKIAVEFSNITINTDYQLISGVVETSYNPDWKNVVNVEDFTGEGASGKIKEEVPFEIDKIVVDANGNLVVNGKNGEQITIPGGKDTIIIDGTGKIYTVDKDGNGSNEGAEPAVGGKSTAANTDGVDKNGQVTEFTAKGISIVFSNNEDTKNGAKSKYAFDAAPNDKSSALDKLYKKAGNVALPYKAVVNGNLDTVLATISLADTAIKLDSIVFKTESGAKIDFVRNGKIFTLTVKGRLTYAEEQILATIKQGDKWKVIGAFILVHISPKEVNVALVPTYEILQSKLDAIISNTQAIYNKVGVKINFTKENRLKIDSVVPDTVDKIQTQKNTLTSTYSSEQQAINNLYHGPANSYVLFITDKASSANIQGYMRLNGQFGYVFNSANEKTPAHELGHGIFKLEHPSEQYKTSESSTDFLMDNSSGTVLNHLDWKQINDPAFKLYAFQSQASGQKVDKDFVLKDEGYFLTPSNKLIKLPKGTQIIFTCDQPQRYRNGALFSFKTPDGFHWYDTSNFALNQKYFNGYFKALNKSWVKDKGQLISYSDAGFKYSGAGKYAVYIISLIPIDTEKSEYRILKQDIQLSTKNISVNNNFSGQIEDLVYKSSDGLVETITTTGCDVKPEEEIGNYITAIESKSKKAVLKIYQNAITGKYTVEAELKGEGNVKTKSQKAAIEKQISDLATEKINELGGLNKDKSKPFFETTDDGGGFYVKEMNGQEWMGTICDLGSNVWESAALPENYWNQDNEGFKNSTIHLPPTLTGVSDGAIGIVSDYPQLIKLAYDVGTKEEVRTGIWTAVKNITPSSVYLMAEDAVKDKISKYNFTDKAYLGHHEIAKDGVAVVSMVMAGSFITKGDDALEKGTKEVGEKIEKEAAEGLRKVFVKNLDETLNKLKQKAKYVLEDTGEYSKVGGHHPLAKKAFENATEYDYKKAFSVKPSALESVWKTVNDGIPQNIHAKITGQQSSLYTAWKKANPLKKMGIEDMADIEIKAMKNVGIPEDIATGWVVKSLEEIKINGVTEIKNIPWNGVN